MKVAEYIFKKLKDLGAKYTFGLPGDFAIPLFHAQEKVGVKPVIVTHEPSAGFAADAYARLRGIGVAVGTFGAGVLNMVNSIAQAYAEESPVVVIGAAPQISTRNPEALVHHRVKTFDTQRRVFEEITAANTALNNPNTAKEDVDKVIDEVLRIKRPGYIEVPIDMGKSELIFRSAPSVPASAPPAFNKAVLDEVLSEVILRLKRSQKPLVYSGVEVERFGLHQKLITLSEKLNLPVVTSLMGKATFPEAHPNFVGTYLGRIGPSLPRQFIEQADCILSLGILLTDINTGFYTAHIDWRRVIQATSDYIQVSYHRYPGVNLVDLLNSLLKIPLPKKKTWKKITPVEKVSATRRKFTTESIIEALNHFLKPHHLVVSDVGDCLFACVSLQADIFLGPGYYASMGFGLPGGLGAQLARPDKRVVILVGDGGFQMTGVEIATFKKLNLNPIIIVLNNGGFATLKFVDKEGSYYTIPSWDYVGIAQSLGARARRVKNLSEFNLALKEAEERKELFLIEVVLPLEGISSSLKKLSRQIARTNR
jgi:indolepyruvate decarboxylase